MAAGGIEVDLERLAEGDRKLAEVGIIVKRPSTRSVARTIKRARISYMIEFTREDDGPSCDTAAEAFAKIAPLIRSGELSDDATGRASIGPIGCSAGDVIVSWSAEFSYEVPAD